MITVTDPVESFVYHNTRGATDNRIGLITSFCFTYERLYSLTIIDSSSLRREFYGTGYRLGVGPCDPTRVCMRSTNHSLAGEFYF
jgi:hypothetical protein